MGHIYNCEFISSFKPAEKYERIFSDNISEHKSVLKDLSKIWKEENKKLKNSPT